MALGGTEVAGSGLVRLVAYVPSEHAAALALRAKAARRSVSAELGWVIERALSEPDQPGRETRKGERDELIAHTPPEEGNSSTAGGAFPPAGSESVLGEEEGPRSVILSRRGGVAPAGLASSSPSPPGECPMPSPGHGVKCKVCKQVHK